MYSYISYEVIMELPTGAAPILLPPTFTQSPILQVRNQVLVY